MVLEAVGGLRCSILPEPSSTSTMYVTVKAGAHW